MPVDKKTPKTTGAFNAYQTALNFGKDGGDCMDLFPHCPNTPQQLMKAFTVLETKAII